MADKRYFIFVQDEDGVFYDPTPWDNEQEAWNEAVRLSVGDGLNRWVQEL